MHGGPLSVLSSWKDFLPPNSIVMAKRRTVRLPLAFEAPDRTNPEASAMLEKMLAALELRAGEYEVFTALPADLAATVTVRFVASAEDSLTSDASPDRLVTYSLAAMLGNPGLKKTVWAQVKDAVVRARRSAG